MNNSVYHFIRPKIAADLPAEDFFSRAEGESTRASYARTMLEIGEKNTQLVVLDADVSKSIGTNKFAEKFPDAAKRIAARRAFMRDQLGIALKPEVLPMSNLASFLPPYWLSPDRAMVLE